MKAGKRTARAVARLQCVACWNCIGLPLGVSRLRRLSARQNAQGYPSADYHSLRPAAWQRFDTMARGFYAEEIRK